LNSQPYGRDILKIFSMNKSKPVIIFSIVLIVVAVLIYLGAGFIDKKLENEIEGQRFGSYRVHAGEIQTSILLRRLKIMNVKIENTLTSGKILVPEINLRGIRLFPLIFKNELIINTVIIIQPEISIIQADPEEDEKMEEAVEQASEINLIQINQLEIQNASFSFKNQTDEKSDTLIFFRTEAAIWDLVININREQFTFNDNSFGRIQLRMNDARYNLPGNLYQMHLDSIAFDTDSKTLNLEKFRLSTLHSKYEIGKYTGVETDWYDISINQFDLVGIDVNALLKDSALVFRKATIEQMDANIFRDKRPPFPQKPDSKLPMEMLESLPFAIHSDSILIKSSRVVYEERAEESSEAGVITFNRLYATIYNLSTIDSLIKGQTAMSTRAWIMNESLLEAEFVFPNHEYSYQYRVSGNLQPVNIATFNPMLVPSAFVRVEEGRIKNLDFDFTYDNNHSKGQLSLEYENLEISLLNKTDGSKKKLKTFIAQIFILPKDNLKDDRSYTEGSISFERDKKKSIFNFWWKSIFSGIEDIVGL
jgi:hypothetical protein